MNIAIVLTRAIPVDGCGTDTCVMEAHANTRLGDVVEWVDRCCRGSAAEVRTEIVRVSDLQSGSE